jgi:hypothetical protein
VLRIFRRSVTFREPRLDADGHVHQPALFDGERTDDRLGIVTPPRSSSFGSHHDPIPITTRHTGQDARSTHSTCAAPDAGTAVEANGLPSGRSLALQHQANRPSSREATAHQEGLVCRSSTTGKEHGMSRLLDGPCARDLEDERG